MSDRSSPRVRHLVFAAGSLYWLVPGHFTLAVTSTPPLDVLSLLGLSWLWLLCYGFDWGREPGGRARAGLLALCLAAAAAAGYGHSLGQSRGLVARYYDNPACEGAVQSSWSATCDGCTRIDRQIAFGPRGHAFTEQYFPLFFANDSWKRSWSPGADAGTDSYGFGADWEGFLNVPAPARLRLESTGGTASLSVGGAAVGGQDVAVSPGTHAIRIRYARTRAEAPSLRLLWDLGSGDQVIPAGAFHVEATTTTGRPEALKTVGLAGWLAALLLLQRLTAPWRLRTARAWWWGGFLALFVKSVAEVAVAGAASGFQVFRPGNDYLVYETFARAILSGDLLSRIEGPLVHLNFAYRYVLAALHLVGGEAPADVMVLEQAAKALIIVLVSARVGRFYGTWSGVATAAVAVGCHQLARLEPPLLDTPWSVGFSALALFALIEYPRRPSSRTASVIGLSLGMAGLLRPNLVPLVAAAVVWMAVAGGSAFPAAVRRHVRIVVGLSLLVLALLPVRNLVVAGDVRWLPENGLVNLWIGNHPPAFDGPTYFIVKSAPPREEIAKRVLEYCLADPGALARRASQKALYVLGIDTRAGFHVAVGVLLPWILAVAGSLLLWRRRAPIARRELLLLWAWIVLVNAPLIVVFPWSYGWRLSAPSFIPIYVLCGVAAAEYLARLRLIRAPELRAGSVEADARAGHRPTEVLVRSRVIPALMLSLLPVSAVSAQELPRGRVVDKVVCARDSSQSYALYLPANYSADRKWPILYAFDPGARGKLPVERFREAAERYGFIVAGSNNSRNGPMTVATDAMNAMLADTQARFGLIPGRLYVTGFSGGARVAVTIGMAMKGQVAGVIGFGAGFPDGIAPSASVPFAFFGAAGTDDFNYAELRQLDQALERARIAHRLEVFAGEHAWPPEVVCARALEWMEIQAMKSGLRARDAALVEQIFSTTMAGAAADEGAGRFLDAYWLYAALAKDFASLRDVSVCDEQARRLGQSREVRQAIGDLSDSVDKQAATEARIGQLAREAIAGEDGARAMADLLAVLTDAKKQADRTDRPADRMAARRALASSWVQFDEAASRGVARGNFAQAAVFYRAMTRIRPENARVEYDLARASARSGSRKDAIEALQRAVAKGFNDVERLKSDPDLDSLRGDPAFRQIVESLGRR